MLKAVRLIARPLLVFPPRGIRMRRATFLIALFPCPIALAACATGGSISGAGGPDPDLATAAVEYSAAMRSGSDNELRQRSCGAYAVVYRNITDSKLAQLRRSATRAEGTFGGSTVLRAEQHGTFGDVTLEDSYVRDGVTSLGKRYTFAMSKDSGSWKVCDSEQFAANPFEIISGSINFGKK
jgi:hypothetical protein